MKHIIIIKPVSHIQIGHLYEHLYCNQLAEHFRNKGLFAYVDYTIDAKTYYDGYVRIEIHLYTSLALANEDDIYSLTINLDEDLISGGLLQIMAEKYVDFWSIDRVYIMKVLTEYNALPWSSLDTVSVISFKSKRKTVKGLELSPRATRNYLNLTQKIVFDTNSTSLDKNDTSALFVVIANALRANLQEEITNNSFCYSVSDSFTRKGKLLIDSNIYRVDKRQATMLTHEKETASNLLLLMKKHQFVDRLCDFLQTTDVHMLFGSPNDEEVSDKVSVLVGKTGWQKIGTKNNIIEVINHCRIEFTLGNTKRDMHISQ